jgi:uncharacterized repeat protein (TIGR02543 family)
MSRRKKNNHYHYAEKYELNSRYMRKKRAVYAPRKAVLFTVLVLIAVGLISTTFAANFGVDNATYVEDMKSTALVAQARSAKANQDLAGTGVNVERAATGGYNWYGNIYFRAPDSWDLSTYPTIKLVLARNTDPTVSTYQHVVGDMSIVGTTSNSRLYHIYFGADHGSWPKEYITFVATNTSYDSGDFKLQGNAPLYTTPYDYGVSNNDGVYLFVPSNDASNSASTANTMFGDYKAERSGIAKQQDAYIYTNGSLSESGGTVNITAQYANGGNYNGSSAIAEGTATKTSEGSSVTHTVFAGSIPGTKTTMSATPATGYTFSGWYTGATTGDLVSSSASYSYYTLGTKTLYARFAYSQYTVTLDANNGTIDDASTKDITHTYNTATSLSSYIPVRYGYTFDGWFTASSGGNQVTSIGATAITANTTYYAHWTRATHSVSKTETGTSGTVVFTKDLTNTTITTSPQSLNEDVYSITVTAPTDYNVSTVTGIAGANWAGLGTGTATLSGYSLESDVTLAITYVRANLPKYTLKINNAASCTAILGEDISVAMTREYNADANPSFTVTKDGNAAVSGTDYSLTTVTAGTTYTFRPLSAGSFEITPVGTEGTGEYTAVSCTVSVSNPTISVSDVAHLAVNGTVDADTLITVMNPGTVTGSVSYAITSGNSVSVSGSTITAIQPGDTTLTATYSYSNNDVSPSSAPTDTFTVHVDTPSFSVSGISIEEGKSGTLTAVDGSSLSPTFQWSESSELISLSDATGSTTTVTAGKLASAASSSVTVTLTAIYNSIYQPTTTCTVTVTPSTYYLGGLGDWTFPAERRMVYNSTLSAAAGTDVYTVTINLSSTGGVDDSKFYFNTKGFKVFNSSTNDYRGRHNYQFERTTNNDTYVELNSLNENDDNKNVKLVVEETGDYLFKYKPSNHNIAVVFPDVVDVTFTDSLNSTSTTVKVTTGRTMTQAGVHAPDDPSKTGYTFEGWKTDGVTYSKEDVEGTAFSANATYTAEYSLNKPTVSVSSASTCTVGDTVHLTATCTIAASCATISNAAYTVTGAYTSADGTAPDGTGNVSLSNFTTNKKEIDFSATIPARYTIEYTVTIGDGTRTATGDTQTVSIIVYPAAPSFNFTITGIGSGTGTSADPYKIGLGSNCYYDVNVTSALNPTGTSSVYQYNWYKVDPTETPISNYESLASGNTNHVKFDPFHPTSVIELSGKVGMTIKGETVYNGFASLSKSETQEVWYYVDSWISSFGLSPNTLQRIYNPNSISGLNLSAVYNALLTSTAAAEGRNFETAVVFSKNSSDITKGVWQDIQTGTGSGTSGTELTAFGPSLTYLQVSGVKYLYLSTREYKTLEPKVKDYEVVSSVQHTTVGSDASAAAKPFYFSTDSKADLSTYRVTAYWLDSGAVKFQHMQPVGSSGMYRAYLPGDITDITIAASNKTTYYASPVIENGSLTFYEPYFVYVTVNIDLDNANSAFANGYNLFTVSSIGSDTSTIAGGSFFGSVTGNLTKIYIPS